MQDNKIVVGLDIGTTKICAIVGTKNEYGKLEVLGMGKAVSDGVIRGIVTNIDKTIMAIEKAIAEASEQSGIEINVVNVGIDDNCKLSRRRFAWAQLFCVVHGVFHRLLGSFTLVAHVVGTWCHCCTIQYVGTTN